MFSCLGILICYLDIFRLCMLGVILYVFILCILGVNLYVFSAWVCFSVCVCWGVILYIFILCIMGSYFICFQCLGMLGCYVKRCQCPGFFLSKCRGMCFCGHPETTTLFFFLLDFSIIFLRTNDDLDDCVCVF